MNTTQLNILLIEDAVEDADLIRTAFEESKLDPQITLMTDGQKGLDYLYKSGEFKNRTEDPDLVILDLNLPKKSGQEVLARIKADPGLKMIPVVVLSTSRSADDIRKCYADHTNCYICKPLNFEEFIGVVREIENFWLNIVQLPHSCV